MRSTVDHLCSFSSAWLYVQAALAGFFMLLLVFVRAGAIGIVDGPAPFHTANRAAACQHQPAVHETSGLHFMPPTCVETGHL